MSSTKWWIMAATSFLVGMFMSVLSMITGLAGIAGVFVILNLVSVIVGWVLWTIGLVTYLRRRRSS